MEDRSQTRVPQKDVTPSKQAVILDIPPVTFSVWFCSRGFKELTLLFFSGYDNGSRTGTPKGSGTHPGKPLKLVIKSEVEPY